jgi:hypothetical protein
MQSGGWRHLRLCKFHRSCGHSIPVICRVYLLYANPEQTDCIFKMFNKLIVHLPCNISEISLLRDTEIVQDELNTILSVLDNQRYVSDRMFRKAAKDEDVTKDGFVKYYRWKSDLNNRVRDIRKMVEDAMKIHNSVSESWTFRTDVS